MLPSVPTLLSPDEGVQFSIGPFAISGRVLGTQSGGAFELYELTLGAATIDYHIHRNMDETICVIAGEIEFTVAGQKFARPAGSVAFIPRGVHHGFTNHGPAEATVLILFTPGGNQDEYFRELERLFSAPSLDPEALQALQKGFDQELVPAD